MAMFNTYEDIIDQLNRFVPRLWQWGLVIQGARKDTIGDQCVITIPKSYGGGGGINIDPAPVLPAIPTSGGSFVFWQSSKTVTGGTGDDQIWSAYAGQSKWTAVQLLTDLDGGVV